MCAMFKRGALFRVAIAMAFLAVFAFVAPPAAVAFVPAKGAIYCLTHDDHGASREHHSQHADQRHSGNVENAKHSHGDAGHESSCCGTFSATALTPEDRQVVRPLLLGSETFPGLDSGVHSLMPELPFRPPIPRPSI